MKAIEPISSAYLKKEKKANKEIFFFNEFKMNKIKILNESYDEINNINKNIKTKSEINNKSNSAHSVTTLGIDDDLTITDSSN